MGRAGWTVSLVLVLALAFVGIRLAGTHPQSQPPSTAPATATWSLVGLGDSITSGEACQNCDRFVDLYAQRITRDSSVPVTVTNLGVGGSTSADLLASLADGQAPSSAVRTADIVTVTIGANDFYPMLDSALQGRCGGDDGLACFGPALTQLHANLAAVLERIDALRADQPTMVRVTGYWNVFPDGAVAEQTYGATFLRTSSALTVVVNHVIRGVADAHQAPYIDLYTPFKGSTGDDDDTPLLAEDGDHPSQAGHEQIAQSLAQDGYAFTRPGP